MLVITHTLMYIMGVVLAWNILRPINMWEQGYQQAKEVYSDRQRGFKDGFDAGWAEAKNLYTDKDTWFESGWNSAFEAIDNSDYIMIRPSEYLALKIEEQAQRDYQSLCDAAAELEG